MVHRVETSCDNDTISKVLPKRPPATPSVLSRVSNSSEYSTYSFTVYLIAKGPVSKGFTVHDRGWSCFGLNLSTKKGLDEKDVEGVEVGGVTSPGFGTEERTYGV